jgi:hypothetical protein
MLKFDIFKFIDWLDKFSFDEKSDIYKKLNIKCSRLHSINPIENEKDKEIFDKLGLSVDDFLED